MERKEAIEIVRKNFPDNGFTMLREVLETLIPELVESDDKRMKIMLNVGKVYIFSGLRRKLSNIISKKLKHGNLYSIFIIQTKITLV